MIELFLETPIELQVLLLFGVLVITWSIIKRG
jgi:hypothetical protein